MTGVVYYLLVPKRPRGSLDASMIILSVGARSAVKMARIDCTIRMALSVSARMTRACIGQQAGKAFGSITRDQRGGGGRVELRDSSGETLATFEDPEEVASDPTAYTASEGDIGDTDK